MRKIDNRLRSKLKKPLGKVYKNISGFRKKGKIIAVGDIASYELIKNKIRPDLIIYDKKVKRKPVSKKVKNLLDSVRCDVFCLKNPRGRIEEEAWIVIEEALKRKSKIVVSGEEDLLVLPSTMLAKNGSIVFYGQPNKGIVLIRVNDKSKRKIKRLVDEMEVVV